MENTVSPDDRVSLREALQMEIVINQALVGLLVAKGVITREDLLTKIEDVRKELFEHQQNSAN